jgi:hypothetical protein
MVVNGWLTCCGEKRSKEFNPPLLLLPLPPLEVSEFSVLSSRPFQGFYLLRAIGFMRICSIGNSHSRQNFKININVIIWLLY